ncbi:MAG: outer membrane beta-barrel protein [Pacificimonas sp.]
MFKFTSAAIGGLVLALSATTAAAQTMGEAQPYIGVAGGWHQLEDFDGDDFGIDNDISISGATYGAYAGVHVPLGETLVIGGEANFNFGTDDIDNEYGLTAHIGTRVGEGGLLFVRGGYQWVDLDAGNVAQDFADGFQFEDDARDDFLAGFFDSVDDTDGDFLVGVGGEFDVMENTALRLTVDSVSFDTVRLGGGVSFRF